MDAKLCCLCGSKPVNTGWTCRCKNLSRTEVGVFEWDYCKDCQPYEPVTYEQALTNLMTYELTHGHPVIS